ncbi:MAG TPA: helicase-related protein, partial [Candidatus Limnocylindria bacterium]|nr:helicase-related protein [Candidatus Limnocylindria bacterium]
EVAPRLTSVHGNEFTAGVQDDLLIEAHAPERIVEKWVELAKGRPTVVFMPLVRSARMLEEAFEAAGIRAGVIHGAMPDNARRAALADYEGGHIQVLCNAMVLTEGWDSPRTKCVIVGRPTKSRPLFVQMAGRGLRPVPGIPVQEQDCVLLCVADSTTDLCSVADLSDRPLERKAQGALTAMEDAWDIGAELADETRLWTGQVDAKQFDPLVVRSSKVWRTTRHGTPFLPISKDGEYVFIVGTSVFVYENAEGLKYVRGKTRTVRLHKDLPDLELAMAIAEDEAQERGGDLGRLLADKKRPWRQQRPSEEMLGRAYQLGLRAEVDKIMSARAGGKAGKVSDLIAKAVATRALEPMVEKIKEATG